MGSTLRAQLITMKLEIDRSLAIRAASILYSRWVEVPLPDDKTVPMSGMNPVYACGVYIAAVGKITGLSCGRIDEENTDCSEPHTMIGL
jgi:hypothetical protein